MRPLGAVRFSDFERMTGASSAVVAERLRAFVDLGVLDLAGEGAREEGRPSPASYRRSAKGRAFFPVVATALAWGEHHFPCADGPAVLAVHRPCQKDFVPELGLTTKSRPSHRAAEGGLVGRISANGADKLRCGAGP